MAPPRRFVLSVPDEAEVDDLLAELSARGSKLERVPLLSLAEGQREILRGIATGAPLPQTLEAVVRLIEARAEGLVGSILLLDAATKTLRHGAAPSLPAEYVHAIDGAPIGPAAGSCGTAAFRGEPVVVEDVAVDPLWADYRDIALAHGLRACWSTPIFSADRQVLGTFAMYFREPRRPEAEHRSLVEVATQLAAVAIERDRQLAQLLRISAAVENTSDLVAIADRDGRSIYHNPAFHRVLGYTPEEVNAAGGPASFVVDASIPGRITEALRARRTWNGDVRVRDREGNLVDLFVRIDATVGARGNVIGLLAICTDVGARRREEERSLRAQRLESLGTLAGGIAHDLNNALTPILISVELLRSRASGKGVEALLNAVESSATRSADLVRQVLSFARGVEGNRTVLRPSAVLEDAARIVRETFPKNVSVSVEAEPGLPDIVADATQIQQVLVNLCLNARDAMPEGGALELSARRAADGTLPPGAWVVLEAADTGTGVPESIREKIFEPFFTTKETGQGTGLGLSTALGIARAHGGYVTVENRPGGGAAFRVFLPAAIESPPAVEPVLSPPVRNGEGERILVIDDEDAIRDVATHFLEASGYRVTTAADGDQAIRLYRESPGRFDVVVTDLNMPVLDGRRTILALREIDPAVRVVAMSGLGADVTVAESLVALGAVPLAKPFSSRALLEAVGAALAS